MSIDSKNGSLSATDKDTENMQITGEKPRSTVDLSSKSQCEADKANKIAEALRNPTQEDKRRFFKYISTH